MGGTSGSGLKINEMVAFLARFDPGGLAAQKCELSAIAEDLEEGVPAGGEPDHSDTVEFEVIKQGASFTLKALSIAAERCRRGSNVALQKITSARRARFVGQMVAIISGSGVIASIAGDKQIVGLVCGALALISSLATAVADYRGALLVDGTDAQKALRDLSSMVFDLDLMASKIATVRDYGKDIRVLASMINESNALIRRLNETVVGLLDETATAP